MSAFQVSSNHLAVILAAWAGLGVRAPRALGFDPSDADTWERTFAKLARVNAESVGYRYREEVTPVPAPRRLMTIPTVSTIAAIKAIDSYCYQSCERPDWNGSPVERAMEAVKSGLVMRLPGYDAAEWSIS